MSAIFMPLLLGTVLTASTLLVMRLVGMHAERGAHSAALIAIALFYVVFAVEHGGPREIAFQGVLALLFVGLALFGFRKSLWWVVAGLVLHGVYDIAFHGHAANPAPEWWGPFCLAVDLILALALAVWIRRGQTPAER